MSNPLCNFYYERKKMQMHNHSPFNSDVFNVFTCGTSGVSLVAYVWLPIKLKCLYNFLPLIETI